MPTTDVIGCLRRAEWELGRRGVSVLSMEDTEGRVDLRHAVIIAARGDDDLALAALVALYEAGARGRYDTDSGPRSGIEGWSDSLGSRAGSPLDACVTLIRRAIAALEGERKR